MIVVYYSRFRNTKAMLKKLNTHLNVVDIANYDGKNEYVLITPTYGIGEVPDEVNEFLKLHYENMLGVISSGNTNWGPRYGNAGRIISETYKVPWLYRYELRGYDEDIENIRKVLDNLYGTKEKLY